MKSGRNTIGIFALFLFSALALPQNQQTNLTADQLHDLAKQAKDKGDLQAEVNYLCQAATLDNKKYGKHCEKERSSLTQTLAQFQADLEVARKEIQQKDYPGAIRDLTKITFGPSRIEAQEALQDALVLGDRIPANQMGPIALIAARRAFALGSFEQAESLLAHVQTSPSLDAAKQLLTDIRRYRDAMVQAANLAHNSDYKGAAKEYQLAISVQPNGPGQPQDRLREMEALIATEKVPAPAAAPLQPSPATTVSAAPAASTEMNTTKIAAELATARRQESRKDLQGAMRSYGAVLKLDSAQTEALAGQKRMLTALKNNSKLEEYLAEAITDFYASRFSDADDKLRSYLQEAGIDNAGAAHFYLASSLLTEAILNSPKDSTEKTSLQQQAEQEFALARQFHYSPVPSSISPKILAYWEQKSE